MNQKTTALVTGANKGIGFETARRLAELGMRVLVGALARCCTKSAAPRRFFVTPFDDALARGR